MYVVFIICTIKIKYIDINAYSTSQNSIFVRNKSQSPWDFRIHYAPFTNQFDKIVCNAIIFKRLSHLRTSPIKELNVNT